VTKASVRIVLVLVIAGALWGAFAFYKQLPRQPSGIATTQVRRDDLLLRTYARGELRATRSATLVAPNLSGPVQVTRLAPVGSFAHRNDLIVEFDGAELKSRLEDQALNTEQLEEQIRKAEADLAIRNNQEQVDLLSARYSVRRAELEVKRNEFLPAADARKNQASLEEAKRRLAQLESDIKERDERAKAELAVLREKKNESVLESNREKARLAQVRLFAPISGLVAIQQNRPNLHFPGMQIPDIRVGDQVNPGSPVAEILDLSELEVVAQVGELDRANLKEGQSALIQLDAIPGQKIKGRVKSLTGAAKAKASSDDSAKKYDVIFSLDMKQLFTTLGVKPEQTQRIQAAADANERASTTAPKLLEDPRLPRAPQDEQQFEVLLRPGLLADIEIIGDKLPNAVHIPAQALFEKDGRLVAYVRKGDIFEARPVTALQRGDSIMVIAKGLQPGEVIALSDPTRKKDRQDKRTVKPGESK